MKIGDVINDENEVIGYLVTSPATGRTHCLSVEKHQFNGNFDAPSFTGEVVCEDGGIKDRFVVRDGKIIYATDSSHEMHGMTVLMTDVDENYDYYVEKPTMC